ncbi:MAG: helix-turn-helix domain-containing protein, partial [Nitrospiraceae bacterium]
MRKLEISDADVMGIAIRQEIERNEEARYDHRLHGLLLVAKGMSARQAALWLDESERTVQRWVNRFEQIGFA